MPKGNVVRTALVATVMLAVSVGCIFGPPSRDEVARISSPSGAVDAIVIEINGGATTSFGYQVHVVPRGRRPSVDSEAAFIYGAIRSERAYGVNPRWQSEDALVIEYLEAKDVIRQQSTVSAANRDIRVALSPGVSDPVAPTGGMLYNLKRGSHQ